MTDYSKLEKAAITIGNGAYKLHDNELVSFINWFLTELKNKQERVTPNWT